MMMTKAVTGDGDLGKFNFPNGQFPFLKKEKNVRT
jgi:hypothetical protein